MHLSRCVRAVLLLFLLTPFVNLPADEADPAESNQQQFATGIVFLDENANREFDANEPAIPNVKVSNGRVISVTD